MKKQKIQFIVILIVLAVLIAATLSLIHISEPTRP